MLADPAGNAERAMEMLEPAQELLDAATALDPAELSPDEACTRFFLGVPAAHRRGRGLQ